MCIRDRLSSYAIAAVGHVVLFAVFLGLAGWRTQPGSIGPSMIVRLAGPRAAPTSGTPRATAQSKAPAPEPDKPEKPSVRQPVAPEPPKNVARKLAGATAQPDQLPRIEEQPQPAPDKPVQPETGEERPEGESGTPGLPGAPVSGGIAGGLGGDEPIGADWYVALVVNRLQDAWRDRPVLPAGEEARRVVVTFVIERDGSVTEAGVQTGSGYALLDTSAQRAVASLGRLPPLPAAYHKDRLRARFVFELLPPQEP